MLDGPSEALCDRGAVTKTKEGFSAQECDKGKGVITRRDAARSFTVQSRVLFWHSSSVGKVEERAEWAEERCEQWNSCRERREEQKDGG